MKQLSKFSLFLFLTAILSTQIFSEDFGAKGAKEIEKPTLEQMLTFALQDEYLARAEYIKIMDKHGDIKPFTNIIKAEIYHVSLLVPLFEKNNITVPQDNSAEHVVIPDDLKTALEIGVQAEIDNIAMYESFLKLELANDVRDVFEKLKKASESHLKAFQNNLKKY